MKKSKVYIRMFFSYLGILAIPTILAAVIYSYTFQVIRGQAEEMNKNLLVMVRQELDQELNNIQKTLTRMALDDRIQAASSVKTEFDGKDQMNLYYIYEACQTVNMSEDFIKDIFVIFNNTRKVVSSRGNMDDALFYDIYYKSGELPFKQFRNYLEQARYGDILTIHTDSGKDVFLYTMTALKSNLGDQSATVCVEVDFDSIRQRLRSMKWSENMDVLVLMDTDERICADEEISGDYELKYANQEAGNYRSVNQLGEKCIISVLPSNMTDWKYISIMSVMQMEEQARKVRGLAIPGLFLCTISGVLISYYMTKRNYNPIRMLTESFKQLGKVEIQAGENEYQWLNQQVDQFFKQHVDAERLLKKNRKGMKNYCLYQLLQGYYDGRPLEPYGIRIKGEFNVVLTFILSPGKTEDQNGPGFIEENALQKFTVMNVFEEMCLEYFNIDMVEQGERVAAVVSVPDGSIQHLDILKTLAENLQQMLEENFGFSCIILLGGICPGWSGIHTSYQQTEKLEEYINLLDASLLVYDEIKDIQPQYEYPMELEQKIINAVKVGDSRQAYAGIEEVFNRNMWGKVTTNVYRCLVYSLIGTLLEGAVQGGYQDAARELEFPDGDSLKLPVNHMKDRFRKLTEEICGKILANQKKAAQDQTLSRKIQEYIQENFQNPDLNISITSQHFDLTPAYMSSIYKKQTGGSLLDYINTIRMDHAEQLLDQGYGVAEVASRSGFRDSGTFIRAFKKKKGVTPGQLKKKL